MGGYVFSGVGRYMYRYIYIYVCEQLGANSSPIVTKLCQSYPWPQGTRWLNFGRSRSLGEVCALLNAVLVVNWTGMTADDAKFYGCGQYCPATKKVQRVPLIDCQWRNAIAVWDRSWTAQFSVNVSSDVSSAEILVPFLFNTICLTYCFWNAYQCDPGVIRTSREEKLQVCQMPTFFISAWIDAELFIVWSQSCIY